MSDEILERLLVAKFRDRYEQTPKWAGDLQRFLSELDERIERLEAALAQSKPE